ncbi:DUF6088 family protein [Cysteiniphilum sp. 6C5]
MKSLAQSLVDKVNKIEKGTPFTSEQFVNLGSRSTIDKNMSRLSKAGIVERIARGVYIRPAHNRFIGSVRPSVEQILQSKLTARGESIQVHGAEALRHFRISTQVPLSKVYYTSGASRELRLGNIKVKLIHTNDKRKLVHAGTNVGLALSALWHLGTDQITNDIIKKIHTQLSHNEFNQLIKAEKPQWINSALSKYIKENA